MARSDDRRELEMTIIQLDSEISRLRSTVSECIHESKSMRRTIHGLKLLLDEKNIISYEGSAEQSELMLEAEITDVDDMDDLFGALADESIQ